MRRLALLAVLSIGCYSRRYFIVPPTEEAHWCLNYCVQDQVRCIDGKRGMAGLNCQGDADSCIASCPGAKQVSYDEWMSSDAGS